MLERVHVDIAGPMPVTPVRGHDFHYIVVDDFTCPVYTRPSHLKSEVVKAFKAFKVVVENESGRKIREVMTDNVRELSTGEMRRFCEAEGIKLSTTVLYHPASNGVADRTYRGIHQFRARDACRLRFAKVLWQRFLTWQLTCEIERLPVSYDL